MMAARGSKPKVAKRTATPEQRTHVARIKATPPSPLPQLAEEEKAGGPCNRRGCPALSRPRSDYCSDTCGLAVSDDADVADITLGCERRRYGGKGVRFQLPYSLWKDFEEEGLVVLGESQPPASALANSDGGGRQRS